METQEEGKKNKHVLREHWLGSLAVCLGIDKTSV